MTTPASDNRNQDEPINGTSTRCHLPSRNGPIRGRSICGSRTGTRGWAWAAALLFSIGFAGAETPTNENQAKHPLAAEIGLKLAAKRGNTDVASGDLKINVARQFDNWRLSFLTDATGATNNSQVIAESVLIDVAATRRISNRMGIVGEMDAFKDRFAGIDWRTTVGAGVAWTTSTDARWNIHTMAGLGWQQEIYTAPSAEHRSYAIGVAQARGVLKISDNTSFRQVLYFAPEIQALDRYLLYLGLTWRARTNDWLSVEIDYVMRYDSDPVLETVSTDHSIRAGFVFTFGKSAATVIDYLLLPPN
jgi:putative salt-induced outer membrane protein YdiY